MTQDAPGRGPVQRFTFDSRVLAGNPLGDPTVRDVWYWTPHDWDGKVELPLFLALTGFTGTGAALFHDAPWFPGLGRRLDSLYSRGRVKACLVAAPDCFTRYGGSQYVNSSATGNYRDYLLEEILPEIQRRFPVSQSRDSRFVFGKSSGGFGALSLAMDHPDVFGAASCQSGDAGFEYCYLPDFPKVVQSLQKHGNSAAKFVESFYRAPKVTSELIHTMNIVAMAACYSPTVGGGFELPFETPSGRLRPAVWERWLALDPVRRVEGARDSLGGLRGLFIDCGTQDEFNLHLGARMLHDSLTKYDIPHEYEEFSDGHMGISYRYERALTWLSQQLP